MAEHSTEHYSKCKTLLERYNRHIRIRLVIMAILLMAGIYVTAYDFSLMKMLLTIMFSVGVLALAFFQTMEQLWLYLVLLAAIAVGTFSGILTNVGFAELVLYLTAIPAYRKFKWIREQPGYPHFSERLDEQMAHREYEPEYHPAPAAQFFSAAEQATESSTSAEMPTVEMPGIDEFPEQS